MNQMNCPICDDGNTWLIFGELYEITDVSRKNSPRHVVVTLKPHRCKGDENAPD